MIRALPTTLLLQNRNATVKRMASDAALKGDTAHQEDFVLPYVKALGLGDVTLLGRNVIHSVLNPLTKISAAIHVYDGEFLTAQRSMWDAETLVEKPYDISAVTTGMPLHDAR
jgi:predicted metal-dependent enzyme (double-stranded beta helix superfamily)